MNEEKKIVLPGLMTVNELAQSFGVPVTVVIKQLLANGVLATINDNIDFETAAIVADDLGYSVEQSAESEAKREKERVVKRVEGGDQRPPVVTVMGHVDHGKTSLLDYIRKTKITERESGGITQHIGAYQAEYKGHKITFLDTPGHEAFSAIRAQGAKVTDVVILVVAADEGIKPQTIEAIELARAANVPIVTAITKIDRPEANILRVEQELATHNIVTEKWGGKDVIIGVSAKTGEGVDELLDLVLLTVDLQELTADKKAPATGFVIETKHDPKVGYTGTLLVQNGTLKIGDPFVVGAQAGKVKSMEDYLGRRVKEAEPAMPVRVTGFSAVPNVGEFFEVVESEKQARELAMQKSKQATARKISVSASDLSRLTAQIRAAHASQIAVVLKADMQGSLEAIKNQLSKIRTDKGEIKIISEGIGNISESDILAAEGEKAIVVGFKVDVSPSATSMAKKDKIQILGYDIIYNLTDDLTKILLESIEPERIETQSGKATVLKIFREDRHEKIIGMKVLSGRIGLGNVVKFMRGDEEIGSGTVKLIKHLTEEVSEATQGNDFGFLVTTTAKVMPDDVAEFVKVDYKKAKLA
ncbi:MAG: translation initiation factor IF-2 [Patescibacteria group bacterium]